MSVIEKLDSVLALHENAKREKSAVGRVSLGIDFDVKAGALIRDHGPAIRQAMIDAERWREFQEKRMPGVTYGCHCDLEDGQEPDGCVIDQGEPHLCIYAKNLGCKEQCEYWRPIDKARATGEGEGHD